MKHFIAFFLSLSVFCFIAFGISVAVLGTEPVSGNVTMREYTELEGEYSDIEISTSVANIAIYPTDSNTTKIFTTERLAKSLSAEIKDYKLIIKLDHGMHIFDDFFGFIASLFDGGNKDCVKVYVPDDLYEKIVINSNAGSTEMINVAAKDIELELSAGNLTYAQPEGARATSLSVHLSAGNCTVYNAQTDKFDIEMSAGNIDVYGLSGTGEIDLSAGNGNINFFELEGDLTVNASAGNLDLNLPEGTNATITCDKSAGSVNVNYGGIKNDLNDNEEVVIGSGKFRIFSDISAGSIDITDKVKEKEAPAVPEMPTPSVSAATDATAVTGVTSSLDVVSVINTSATVSPTWDREPNSQTDISDNHMILPVTKTIGKELVEYKIDCTEAICTEQELNFDTKNINVAIYPTTESTIKIYTSKNIADKLQLKHDYVSLNVIYEPTSAYLSTAEPTERIEVYLPTCLAGYSIEYQYDINLSSDTGNVKISNIVLRKIDIQANNGDLTIAYPEREHNYNDIYKTDIEITNGDLTIYNARLDYRFDHHLISVTNGKVNLHGLEGTSNTTLTNCTGSINIVNPHWNSDNSHTITTYDCDMDINLSKTDISALIDCDISSGSTIEINCDDINRTITNDAEISLRNAERGSINVNATSSKINITENMDTYIVPSAPNPPIFEAA